MEREEAKELGGYLHELDLAATRALVLSGELTETPHRIDLEEVVRLAYTRLPEQIRRVVEINSAEQAKAWLHVPLFAFALRDIILTLWKYGNGKDGIFVEYGKNQDKVFFELWARGKGLPDAARQEVLDGKVIFHPRGNYYGQGVLSLRVCKKIIEELHSTNNHPGTFREIGNEQEMRFRIEIYPEALNRYGIK